MPPYLARVIGGIFGSTDLDSALVVVSRNELGAFLIGGGEWPRFERFVRRLKADVERMKGQRVLINRQGLIAYNYFVFTSRGGDGPAPPPPRGARQ